MLFQLDQLHATISEPLGEDVALKGMIRNSPPSSTPARRVKGELRLAHLVARQEGHRDVSVQQFVGDH